MALASVADVQRELGVASLTAAEQADIEKYLETAEEYAAKILRTSYDAPATPTTRFEYDVAEDAQLDVPPNSTSVTVQTYLYADSNPLTLTVNEDYSFDSGRGELRLRPSLVFEIFEGASASRLLRRYEVVKLTYTPPTPSVPAPVRDGVALLAASLFKQAPQASGGLQSESLGDYSYSLASGGGGGGGTIVADTVMKLWRPYIRRKILVV